MDALLDGLPPPADAQAALSDAERDEVAGMVRTANLMRLTLHAAAEAEKTENGENAALQKAQVALQNRVPLSATVGENGSAAPNWWTRLLKRKQQ